MAIAAGQHAFYARDSRQVTCLPCTDATNQPTPAAEADLPDPGVAGASAHREHQRRVTKREQRIRAAHPRLGGLILAITDEPQTTSAWQRGAQGEQMLGQRLDGLADRGVLLLHDRRIPGGRSNIDHIAISAAGVFVIDAKRYRGRPELRIEGGLLRPRTEKLIVGGRDCSNLIPGVTKQADLVRTALASDPDTAPATVRGMLCFVDADWPLLGGAFTIAGIDVLSPAKATNTIAADGLLTRQIQARVHAHLAHAFPPA
jgi:hypothetical protein